MSSKPVHILEKCISHTCIFIKFGGSCIGTYIYILIYSLYKSQEYVGISSEKIKKNINYSYKVW